MATIGDIAVSVGFNLLNAFIFLLAFAVLRIQPFNDKVYFPKWYLKGLRNSPFHTGAFVSKFVNLDFRSYLKFLNWMSEAIKMPESELIEHAWLDSTVYLRIYIDGYWLLAAQAAADVVALLKAATFLAACMCLVFGVG